MKSDSNSAVLDQGDDCPSPFIVDRPSLSVDFPFRSPHSPRSTFRVTFLALLISTVALLAALGRPLLTGQVYTADDLGWFHLPMRSFYAQQLSHNEPFDWCPDLYCGFYLTGEGQTGSYHPLHWLLYRTLPLSVAFDLECWLSYPVMLVGMYLFLRRWKLRREAAWFGALAFTFCSFNLLHFIHLNGIAIVAHLPWLLWAIDVMLRKPSPFGRGDGERADFRANTLTPTISQKQRAWKRNRRLAFCGVALLTGSQLLLGYPQYVFFSLTVEAGYVLLVTSIGRTSLSTVAAGMCRWIIAVLIGAFIGGVQLLPTFDALQHSVRQSTAAVDFATQGSLPLLNLMQLVDPYLFATRVIGGITHEFGLYMGAVPFVLAVWWIFGGQKQRGNFKRGQSRQQMRALTIAAEVTAGVSLLWMMGNFGPLGWMQAHFPLVNKFRLPCRAIVAFQLALAVLATLGFADLLRPKHKFARREQISPSLEKTTSSPASKNLRQLLWALPLASAAFTLLAIRNWLPYLGPLPLVALGPVMMAAAVCLVLRAANGARWALAALIFFTAIDLGVYGMSDSVFGHTEPLAKFVAKIDVPPVLPQHRVALDLASGMEAAPGLKTVRSGDEILLAGWKRVDGYAGLDPAKQLDYRNPAALCAAGATWLAAEANSQLEKSNYDGRLPNNEHKVMMRSKPIVSLGNDTIWFRMSHSQPRAWLVTRTVPSENPAADIAHISLANEALVDKNVAPLAKAAATTTSPNVPGTVTTITDRPGDLALSVNCPTAQFLVVTESYHNGWQATVDNQSASILRADGDFIGVVVTPGEHEIVLKFQPESLRYGRLASGFGLSLMVVMLVAAAWPVRWRRD
jgi:hypothetical protein